MNLTESFICMTLTISRETKQFFVQAIVYIIWITADGISLSIALPVRVCEDKPFFTLIHADKCG